MNLSDCLNADVFVSSPQERTEPEQMWTDARDSRVIPESLYHLYRETNYLSPSGIAGWETESGKVVSGYFSRVVRSLAECVIESSNLNNDMLMLLSETYTPLKRARGESWDRDAPRKFRSAFRLWLIDVTGALDSLAEITGILLPGAVKDLGVGHGASGPLLKWASSESQTAQGVIDPITHYAETLRVGLHAHVTLEPRHDWLRLVRIYRNKLTHFGHQAFVNFGLQGPDSEVYYFLPREWPFNPEKYMTLATPLSTEDAAMSVRRHLTESLVSVDTATFLQESSRRLGALLETALGHLLATYRHIHILRVGEIASQIQKTTNVMFEDFSASG